MTISNGTVNFNYVGEMHVQIANLSSVRTVKVQAAEFREILVGEATEQS